MQSVHQKTSLVNDVTHQRMTRRIRQLGEALGRDASVDRARQAPQDARPDRSLLNISTGGREPPAEEASSNAVSATAFADGVFTSEGDTAQLELHGIN